MNRLAIIARQQLWLAAATVVAVAVGCATRPTMQPPQLAQDRFFANLAQLEGQRFPGRAVFMIEPDSPFDDADLIMHVASVDGGTMRIALHVDDDRSRTWVLSLTSDRLHLRHDHRYPNGTPHELTDYGGWAADDGTALRQRFPADAYTRGLIPEAATNVWTLEMQPDRDRFVYDLTRHGRPRFRAEFDLNRPLP